MESIINLSKSINYSVNTITSKLNGLSYLFECLFIDFTKKEVIFLYLLYPKRKYILF